MSVDAQGSEVVRPFTEKIGDAFPILVDSGNLLGRTFGFKAVPNGVLVAAGGKIDAIKAGKFDIQRPETRELVESWLAGAKTPSTKPPPESTWSAEAGSLYEQAVSAVGSGDRKGAARLLRRAHDLGTDNLIIRKQIWAIEHPERFYLGDIDHEWQRRQPEQDPGVQTRHRE